MSPFERLHPAIQHHVVNSLGWKTLRPLQEAAIEPILAASHALLLAPTAGGKTEAAILPVLSRMLSEDWRGLSVIYLCPIKALINNLEQRLSHYASLFGRRVGVWHGDIGSGEKARLARDPPDLLLATPESIEVVLVSRRVDHRSFFRDLRVVVVDEIHAFAGDDRGWHLIALLDRLTRLSGRAAQRLGLSATVGNASALLDWLVAGSKEPRVVVAPDAGATGDAEVTADFVGNLGNAATVISRLHQGEKRLVFCDSRSQVESLAVELRARGVSTFVSHSSLSVDARRQAEAAFAVGNDCVIVATSTLELGIDVGDLDRVIQIDAPHTVAGLLQRLGRSGRRSGAQRNCLFLATGDDGFLRALAILRLWQRGYVESVVPPALPYPVCGQQVLALALQETGVGRHTWTEWLPGFLSGAEISRQDSDGVTRHMIGHDILFEADGLLSVGQAGEAKYGLKNFLELFSVFNSPPVFRVLHGRSEIGQVHQLSFQVRGQTPVTLTLGGRHWAVKHVDWGRRQAFVEPTAMTGGSRWMGTGQALSFELCQEIRRILGEEASLSWLSKRGAARLEELREDYAWVGEDRTVLLPDRGGTRWWTFAGGLLNSVLAAQFRSASLATRFDEFSIYIGGEIEPSTVEQYLRSPRTGNNDLLLSALDARSTEAIKFIECVPTALRHKMVAGRLDVRQQLELLAEMPVAKVIEC